jgi:hypothetical protein
MNVGEGRGKPEEKWVRTKKKCRDEPVEKE